MKIIATLLLLTINLFSFSQKISQDTTASFIGDWKKGDGKIIEIVRTKEATRSGKPSPPFTFTYEAHVSILDSSNDGYTIQWVFHLPDEYKKANPGIEEVMPVYEGLKMIFKTTNVGAFKELINWKEVKDAYIAMMEVSVSKNITDSTRAIINKTYEIFNSRQMIEGAFIKEIQLYHSPYGGEFTSNGIEIATSMDNPFGGESMPAITTQQLTKSDANSFTAIFSQELDSSGLNIMMGSMLKKFDIPLASFSENEKDALSKFQMKDFNEYRLQKSTSWLSEVTHERIVMMADTKQKETFTLRLK